MRTLWCVALFAGMPNLRHDQWGLVLDKKWVEERLKTPYERR
jgi:hypothetical protein